MYNFEYTNQKIESTKDKKDSNLIKSRIQKKKNRPKRQREYDSYSDDETEEFIQKSTISNNQLDENLIRNNNVNFNSQQTKASSNNLSLEFQTENISLSKNMKNNSKTSFKKIL
jgi:hypothetical protein